MSKCIIVIGNPIDGLSFFGPFDGLDEANTWADKNVVNNTPDWWMATIQGSTPQWGYNNETARAVLIK